MQTPALLQPVPQLNQTLNPVPILAPIVAQPPVLAAPEVYNTQVAHSDPQVTNQLAQ